MNEVASYQARVVNVNNIYSPGNDYLPFVLALMQHIDESVIAFDADFEVFRFNDRLGTFANATRRDMRTVDTVCAYMGNHYVHAQSIKKMIIQCTRDLEVKRFDTLKLSGDMVAFKIIPVAEKNELVGVVLMARIWAIHNDTMRKRLT